jgi:hypothetical protein
VEELVVFCGKGRVKGRRYGVGMRIQRDEPVDGDGVEGVVGCHGDGDGRCRSARDQMSL